MRKNIFNDSKVLIKIDKNKSKEKKKQLAVTYLKKCSIFPHLFSIFILCLIC